MLAGKQSVSRMSQFARTAFRLCGLRIRRLSLGFAKIGVPNMRLDILAAVALLGLVVTACAVPVTEVRGPDGTPAYVLKCSGYMRDRQDCLKMAGEVCPTGYRLVDDSSQVSGAMVLPNGIVGVAHRDYLTISCK